MNVPQNKNSHPKISIIIPAYNVENYILSSLESAREQTIPAHEIIVINDGSTDSTLQKAELFARKQNIQIITTENRGPGSARNTGLRNATGDYVYFFDSDDLISPNFVELISFLIEKYNQPDIIFFSGESFFDSGHHDIFFPPYNRTIEGTFSSPGALLKALHKHNCFFASPCLYISKRNLWTPSGISFKEILHEDEEAILKLILSAMHFYVTKDIFFKRRIRKNSIMTSPVSKKRVSSYKSIVESLLTIRDESFQGDTELSNIWKERVATFMDRYISAASIVNEKVEFKLAARAAIAVNQPWFYIRLVERFLNFKITDA